MPVGPTIIVHGGLLETRAPYGAYPMDWIEPMMKGVKTATAEGYHCMMKGGSAVDAVEKALRFLEAYDYFHVGGVASAQSQQQAAMMDGATLNSGAVVNIANIKHPITFARRIMEKYPDVCLSEERDAYLDLANEMDVLVLQPDGDVINLFAEEWNPKTNKYSLSSVGVVGAVAYDMNGNVAAGTSTGAPCDDMSCGFVYNSAVIGRGTFADNDVGAVCDAGNSGGYNVCLANSISHTMQNSARPINACRIHVEQAMKRFKKKMGAIAISKNGEVGFATTADIMPIAYITNNTLHFGSRLNRIQKEHCYRLHLNKRTACCCYDNLKCNEHLSV